MRRYLRLIWLFARVSIQNETAYRLDLFFRLFVAVGHLAGELFGLWTIFSNTNSIGGWGVYEVLVLLGVFRMMTGVMGTIIAPNMRATMEDIRNGTLDFVLTRPLNAQFYASFRSIVVWRGLDIVLGAIIVAIGCSKLSASLSLFGVFAFVVALAIGTVLIYAVWLMLATTAFWFTRLANVEMVFWNVFEAGRYPIDIYRPWLRWALTFIVPLAFITTFPAAALVGKASPWALLGGLLGAAATFTAATLLWRTGLRRYSGASA